MSKRLVQVAKELNVGTTTLVDHLNKSGFEVENNPRTKLTDEMFAVLSKEFQGSFAIKKEANKINIGQKPEKPKEEVVRKEAPKLSGLKVQGKIELDPKKSTPKPEAPKKPEVKPAEKPVAKAPEKKADKPQPKVEQKPVVEKKPEQPKVKAKEAPKKPVKKQIVETKPVEIQKIEQKPTVEKKPVAKDADKKEATTDSNVHKTQRVELTGPKILGKISLPVNKPKKKDAPKGDSNRPKRKRKTVIKSANTANGGTRPAGGSTPGNNRGPRPAGGGPPRGPRPGGGGPRRGPGGPRRGPNRRGPNAKKEEVKEVSQKEIQDKIKATMARLSGGGKNKRQKIRRGNRERIREKQEELASQESQTLKVTEFISVSELANLMNISISEIITTCMNMGVIVSINQRLDAEMIELLGAEFNHEIEFISAEAQSDEVEEEVVDKEEDLVSRAPIVTVMGHVDHGKTSLLDYIRKAKVTEGEAGGITQHIGAYEVKIGDKPITFLDTPGHEAFTAMRARGAKVTDVAIIIIAADDSIMPQTKEAISHAQAAGVPIIFAINKIDKPGASSEKIKDQLSQMNFLVEEWGGKYQSQDISAKKGTGIDELLEKVILEAEMLELKANPERDAIGAVLESSLEKGKGYVTKVLVQTGTLKIGDPIVAGGNSGKVKAMFNDRGKRVKVAGPSSPVAVLGLDGATQAGEKIKVTASEQDARSLASNRAQIDREQQQRASKRISLDDIGRRLALGNFKELNLIIKGDVDGSIEALSDSLLKLSVDTVQVNIIHKAVGQIVESDVLLASASDAIIIGFQVRPSANARGLAEQEGVEIKTYSIIYAAIEEIKSAIEGMLEPTKEEKVMGTVQVRETFKLSKVGTIAGCFVQNGKITRNSLLRVVRGGIVVYPKPDAPAAKLSSLKRFKDDVKEVTKGYECGLTIENFNDIKQDDELEIYEIVEVKQKLK